jgi:serine/threonine-protein kinase
VGSQLIGRKFGQYRVVERLGRGAMGSVYRATDEMLGRDVALKILDTTMEGATARFRVEAAALARLSHPGIAAVHELVEDDGHLVMAMEFVRGQTLQQILEHVGVFSPRRAADLCMQALAALEHAHAAGVVHRDLKPGNLMLTESGSIKIMDFGIARLEGTVFLTSAGAMLGTPAYMSPEQVLGHPVDLRADLYAIGVVLFRLVTGELPLKADTPFDMAQAQVNDAPLRASEVRPDLPEWVDTILSRALQKKPADRFQLAMEFHEALARATADTPAAGVTPAVESTERMVRPDFGPPAVAVAPDKSPKADEVKVARTRLSPAWLSAGAAAALAGAVWLSAASGLAPSETPAPDKARADGDHAAGTGPIEHHGARSSARLAEPGRGRRSGLVLD